jgi:DNA/RNA-binding domain of Phe-tRNA-synthetase-like protein
LSSFLVWDEETSTRFPNLLLCIGVIRGVEVKSTNAQVEALRRTVTEEVRGKYKLELLKDNPTVRAYRDLFWSLDIDPTKTRPSGEALLRRVLHGKEIPRISTVVDSYNLASLKTIIPLSGFDLDILHLPLCVRFSRQNEEFHGIGIDAPIKLDRKMLVLVDGKQIVCIYPYRDAETTKIAEKTRNVVIVGYGAPKIHQSELTNAVENALSFIQQTSGGKIETVSIFKSESNH